MTDPLIVTVTQEVVGVSTSVERFEINMGVGGPQGIQGPAGDLDATIFDAKGDLIGASAADTAVRVPAGSNLQALIRDDSATSGLSWIDRPHVDVSEFDAPTDGTDGTTEIEAAWAEAKSRGVPLVFTKKGTYFYNGTGLTGSDFNIYSTGGDLVLLEIGAGKHFIAPTGFLNHLHVQGLRTRNGAGVIRHTFTGVNVTDDQFIVRECRFVDYTDTCIGSLSIDMPGWKIQNNLFYAKSTSTSSIGIALAGLTDQVLLEGNDFLRNRIHVKLAHGGNSCHIRSNAFLRFSAFTTFPRVDIWCVPRAVLTNAGTGFVCNSNRFGNENLAAADYRILYADSDTGSGDFTTQLPILTADSTGYIVGHEISDNMFAGNSGNGPLIYSTASRVIGLNMRPNSLTGATPSLALEFRTVPTTNRMTSSNLIGGFHMGDLADTNLSFPISNDPGFGQIEDHNALFESRGEYPTQSPVGDTTGYVNLLPTAINSFTLVNVTKVTDTDWYGQNDAIEGTFTTTSGLAQASLTKASIVVGKPAWIECDIKAGSSDSLSVLYLQISDSGNRIIWRRSIRIPLSAEGWIRYQFPYTFRADDLINSSIQVRLQAAGTTGKAKIGRVAVYHGRSPVERGPIGWGNPTGTATRTTFDTTSVTLPQLAERMKALIDDLKLQQKLKD